MTCNCNQPKTDGPQRKGVVKFCDICDPCNEAKSDVRLCAFVVPTLEEGRYYRNSFIFVEEDDSVYYISDDRSEIPFGSRPKFIEDFDPTDAAIHYKSTVVYDVKNHAGYVYDPEGNMVTIALTAAPFSSLTAGDGILVTADGGNYTVAIDPATVASTDDLHNVTLLVTNHTTQIGNLEEAQDTMAGDIETIEDEVAHVSDLVDDANELAVEAKENATAAQQTANDALSAVATKQDSLTAGEGITIQNNVISATATSYSRATTTENGLMSTEDRKVMKNKGIYVPSQTVATTNADLTLTFSKSTSNEDGSTYTEGIQNVVLPASTATTAGVMSAADKTKLDGIDMSTKQDVLTAGSNITIQNNVISATGGGGGVTILTQDDYNYDIGNTGSNNTVALWLLPEGIYVTEDTTVNISPSSSGISAISPLGWREYSGVAIVGSSDVHGKHIVLIHNRKNGVNRLFRTVTSFAVNPNDGTNYSFYSGLDDKSIADDLTTTDSARTLSANQGKVLKDLIDALDARVTALEGN